MQPQRKKQLVDEPRRSDEVKRVHLSDATERKKAPEKPAADQLSRTRESVPFDHLFYLLWRRNEAQGFSSCPHIYVPDTIVYHWAQPHAMYSCVSEGQMQRTKREKISNWIIYQALCKRPAPCGVVAMYTEVKVRDRSSTEEEPQTRGVTEYFDKAQLAYFLNYRPKSHLGLLQKFVENKEERCRTYKVTWSPNCVWMEVCTNVFRLNDHTIPLMDRLVTVEGAQHLVETTNVRSPSIVRRLGTACDAMVEHFAAVTNFTQRLLRMVIYFRIDPSERLWLLFASSLHFGASFATLFPLTCSTPRPSRVPLYLRELASMVEYLAGVREKEEKEEKAARAETERTGAEPGGPAPKFALDIDVLYAAEHTAEGRREPVPTFMRERRQSVVSQVSRASDFSAARSADSQRRRERLLEKLVVKKFPPAMTLELAEEALAQGSTFMLGVPQSRMLPMSTSSSVPSLRPTHILPAEVANKARTGARRGTSTAAYIESQGRQRCPSCLLEVPRRCFCPVELHAIIDYYGLDFSFVPTDALRPPSPPSRSSHQAPASLPFMNPFQLLTNSKSEGFIRPLTAQSSRAASRRTSRTTYTTDKAGGRFVSRPATADAIGKGAVGGARLAMATPSVPVRIEPVVCRTPQETIERVGLDKLSIPSLEKTGHTLGRIGTARLVEGMQALRNAAKDSFHKAKMQGESMSYLHGLKNLLADKEVSYLIPQVVQSAFPTMSIDQFVVCCQDPAFRYSSVKICEDCFLRFTRRLHVPQMTWKVERDPSPALDKDKDKEGGGVRSRYASLPVYRGYDWWLKAYAEYNAFKYRPNANELITALPDDHIVEQEEHERELRLLTTLQAIEHTIDQAEQRQPSPETLPDTAPLPLARRLPSHDSSLAPSPVGREGRPSHEDVFSPDTKKKHIHFGRVETSSPKQRRPSGVKRLSFERFRRTDSKAWMMALPPRTIRFQPEDCVSSALRTYMIEKGGRKGSMTFDEEVTVPSALQCRAAIPPSRYCMVVVPQPPANSPIIATLRKARQLNR
ncbi:unnamed protein product [Vitrella brassicaformis CCMP3155]|uniref:Uncharacterized protein n=1 Tax=Vitrella brassicaformis (strain CCMP3155) TaxID=1169540 RepID=A0A0G4GLU4_VITBC|nr:unnamed protein product [Vitrella brassicaformis CCMP3155]|eukprot:CEM31089.1 unnamed protein product [Vitrella brassicaformis CCMP3155]